MNDILIIWGIVLFAFALVVSFVVIVILCDNKFSDELSTFVFVSVLLVGVAGVVMFVLGITGATEYKTKTVREYTIELYSFARESEASSKSEMYYLIIENNETNVSSEYKISYIIKTEEGLYKRETLIVDENKSFLVKDYHRANLYYDFQKDKRVSPKLIIKTEGYSEEAIRRGAPSNAEEVIISYTFVIHADNIKYKNVFDD